MFACSDETVQETNSYPTLEKCLFCTLSFSIFFYQLQLQNTCCLVKHFTPPLPVLRLYVSVGLN